MNNNYDQTPSFYNSESVFKKYLAQTSYYLALQNNLSLITKILQPNSILDLGCGTGATSIRLGVENPTSNIVAIDFRKNMIDIGKKKMARQDVSNVKFLKEEMCDYVEQLKAMPDLAILLYSFHHIPDPNSNKINFLKHCYERMNKSSYLCIAETFLPESINPTVQKSDIAHLWSRRILEGYSSTFWSALKGISNNDISNAHEAGEYSMKYEKLAGELVLKRDEEYLVELSWLKKQALEIGYEIVLAEPCNALGESIILLKV